MGQMCQTLSVQGVYPARNRSVDVCGEGLQKYEIEKAGGFFTQKTLYCSAYHRVCDNEVYNSFTKVFSLREGLEKGNGIFCSSWLAFLGQLA